MLRIKLFDGVERELKVYNGQAILDYDIDFFTEECDTDLEEDEEDFTFPAFSSAYFRIFNERLGTRLRNLVVTRSGSSLVINASALDMTFDQNGKYFYEIGYTQTGGYEIALMYGPLKVV